MKNIKALLMAMIICSTAFAQTTDTMQKELKAVTVIAKKPLVRQEADRIVYDLQADPMSKASSVLDMMRKVPHLFVDANDNILLNGSATYKVFINGRPSGLMANNPKEVLRSMPASTIKSIEVITHPPAKYDAEGMAGIINIVTNRQTANGYKGSVNIYEKDPVGGPGGGGSFTMKKGRIDISAFAGISRYKVPETDGDLNQVGTEANPTNLHQHIKNTTNSYTAYAGLELNYELDSLNLISGDINGRNSEERGWFKQVTRSVRPNLMQYYELSSHSNNDRGGADAEISYQRSFKAHKDQLLAISYRYLESNSSIFNDIVLANEINYPIPDYRQYNKERYTDHMAQVEYVQPIKRLTIEGGIKCTFRNIESKFRYDSLNAVGNGYETDPVRSNSFNNRQYIPAAFNSYTYQQDAWQLKAGVRVEQTINEMSFTNSTAALQQTYLSLIPSFIVNKKLKDESSLRFSFSKRIQRPSATELNPFVDRSNPNFETAGNAYLRPITSDAYELGYARTGKASFNISVCGWFFNDVLSALPFYDTSTNITLTRFENYGKGRVLKTNMSFNYSPTAKWSFSANSDIRHVMVSGVVNNIKVENDGFCIYVYASAGHSFDKGWRVNGDISYQKMGISLPLGTMNGFIASSFSVNKSIHSKFSLSAAVNNPFTKYRYIKETITGYNFIQASQAQSYFRRFTVSMNYRFGKLKEEVRRNKRTSSDEI